MKTADNNKLHFELNRKETPNNLMPDLSAGSIRKLSIITPSLNRVEMLKAAVQSVIIQGYSNYEHIIIDAGSIDGTLEFIKTQPQIRWVCEPDRGMYDGLNKGLALASGEVIGFLNTDDLYAEGVFNEVMRIFSEDSVLMVAGRADVFFDGIEAKPWIKLHYSPQEQSLLESSTIGGNYFNAWFFRNTVFDLIGGFNPAYKIVGDRDLMLRIALNKVPFKTIDKLAYLYRSHTGSLTFDRSDTKQKLRDSELFEMAAHYVRYQNLSLTEKRSIVQFHTESCLAWARWHERSGDVMKYLSVVMDCIRYDPYSILRVLRYLIRTIFNQSTKIIRNVLTRQ